MKLNVLLYPDDDQSSALARRALQDFLAEEVDAALAACRTGLAANPADELLSVILTASHLRRNQPDDALAALAALRQAAPHSFLAHYNTGHLLLVLDRRAEALESFRTAVQLSPRSPEAHYMLGTALHSQTLTPAVFEQAREHFRMAAELDPDSADAHCYHGLFCYFSSREEEGEKALRRALALKPNEADINFGLATLLLEQDRVEEAVTSLRRAIELKPDHALAADCLEKITSIDEERRSKSLPRYPRAASEYDDLRRLFRNYILTEFPNPKRFIHTEAKVFTLGSCFAQNIAAGLKQYGVAANCVPCTEDINNTYANRYLLEWVEGQQHAQTEPYLKFFGSGIQPTFEGYLRDADVAIISLGVAPCFFQRQTGEFVPMLGSNFQVALRAKNYDFRTTSVAENVDNLQVIARILRRFNPQVQIVLTVSPVPLKATFERRSAIVADCISKSTLRVAAHEFQQLEGDAIVYWPSFEMVRWCGGHLAQVFGNDDGSPFHVSQQVIDAIIESFIRTFGNPELCQRLG